MDGTEDYSLDSHYKRDQEDVDLPLHLLRSLCALTHMAALAHHRIRSCLLLADTRNRKLLLLEKIIRVCFKLRGGIRAIPFESCLYL